MLSTLVVVVATLVSHAACVGVDEFLEGQALSGSYDWHGYTGYVPTGKIPALRMNDGPQGFRGIDHRSHGTSTAYPCSLALASTFDAGLVRQTAASMGAEFILKGANVFLGPALNLHRVPRGGRNFEYLSGEDPHLGYALAKAYVEGIQSNVGLIATAKHWIANNQEHNRFYSDSVVDERTIAELYRKPFEGCVVADVGAMMCSYNLLNGVPSCQSETSLKTLLRRDLEFKGFVMSDWFAVKSTYPSLKAGMDVEMPVGYYYSDSALRFGVQHKLIDVESEILPKIERLKFVAEHFKLKDKPPQANPHVDATSDANRKMARTAASKSFVLLKNSKSTLPITGQVSEVDVIGDVAHVSPMAVGGGSGHVVAKKVVSAFEGLVWNAPSTSWLHSDFKLNYFDSANYTVSALKNTAVVCVGVGATEGEDRAHLNIASEKDLKMLSHVVKHAHEHVRLVLVVFAPGSVAFPPHVLRRFDSIVIGFLPGEQVGNALADVLYGKTDFRGRLPISIPASERDADRLLPSKRQYPGVSVPLKLLETRSHYDEGQFIGYAGYRKLRVSPSFEFGFGLSTKTPREFSSKHYRVSKMKLSRKRKSKTFSLKFRLKIKTPEPEVLVQLYVSHPIHDLKKPRQLKAFKWTKGGTVVLEDVDLSVWSPTKRVWGVSPGRYTFELGVSSSKTIASKKFFLFSKNRGSLGSSGIVELKDLSDGGDDDDDGGE